MNSAMNSMLEKLRKQIDEIDEKLINIFAKRANIVQQVKNIKEHSTDAFQLYIKPEREFNILKKVTQQAEDFSYKKEFLFNTWRGIISASNFIEQDLNLVATCRDSQVELFQHFGMQRKVELLKSNEAFIMLMENIVHVLAFNVNNSTIFDLLKKHGEVKIFSIARINEDILLCGKVVSSIVHPAIGISTYKTENILNEEAKIYKTMEYEKANLGFYFPSVF